MNFHEPRVPLIIVNGQWLQWQQNFHRHAQTLEQVSFFGVERRQTLWIDGNWILLGTKM